MDALVLNRSKPRCQEKFIPGRVEKPTITGHAGLARNTSRDEDNLGALKGGSKALRVSIVAGDGALGVDVRDVGSNTWQQG